MKVMKKIILIILLFHLSFLGFTQLMLEDIPYKLSEINKRDINGKQGIWYSYERTTHLVYSMENYKNDTLNGYFEYYWFNGNISDKGYYKNGKFDSIFIGYWENGQINGILNYKNGVFNGIVTNYDKEGKLILKKNFINGKLDENYKDNYLDTTLVYDDKNLNKIDTVITTYNFKWNKEYAIYINDTLVKRIDFYKNRTAIEYFYNKAILIKRIIYSKRKPYNIEKIIYFKDGLYERNEVFDKKGNLITALR